MSIDDGAEIAEDDKSQDFKDNLKRDQIEIETNQSISNFIDIFIDKEKPNVAERLTNYGLNPSESEKILQDTKMSMRAELRTLNDPERLQELKTGALDYLSTITVKNEALRSTLSNRLSSLTNLDLLVLINHKLTDKISEEDKLLLGLLRKGTKSSQGTYYPNDSKIKLPLLSSSTSKDYSSGLHHEVTHYCLDKISPVVTKAEFLNGLFKTDTPEQQSSRKFLKLARTINESTAHSVVKYFGEQDDPHYLAYQSKIAPELFKQFYGLINDLSQGRSLTEFDQTVGQLYADFSQRYSPDMTREDLLSTVKDFTIKCVRLKKK